jgi:hypothetical protein
LWAWLDCPFHIFFCFDGAGRFWQGGDFGKGEFHGESNILRTVIRASLFLIIFQNKNPPPFSGEGFNLFLFILGRILPRFR